MAKPAPPSKDVQDFQFRLHCKLKVFDYVNDNAKGNNSNLVTAASRYGLVFVGSNQPIFHVVNLKDVESISVKNREIQDYPRRNVPIPSIASHLQVNCDNTLLAVIVRKSDCPVAIIYKTSSFLSQNVVTVTEIRLSAKPGVKVLSTCWNPTIQGLFTVCKDDGSLSLYELKDASNVDIHELPPEAKAACMCWSPKGKQLVVGSSDGRLIQYKPDLKAVKAIDAPPLNGIHAVGTVHWISNYQFAAVFLPPEMNNHQASLIIIDAPKAGQVTYTNFDDICYSSANKRDNQFYLEHLATWGTLLVASANSMELGVLGGESEAWTQWIQDGGNRCELPLGARREDTLPIGLAITTGTTKPFKLDLKSEDIIPPAPLLLILSNHGLLCCFNVINLLPGVPQICSPPEVISDQSGAASFVIPTVSYQQSAPAPMTIKAQPQSEIPVQTIPKISTFTPSTKPASMPLFDIPNNQSTNVTNVPKITPQPKLVTPSFFAASTTSSSVATTPSATAPIQQTQVKPAVATTTTAAAAAPPPPMKIQEPAAPAPKPLIKSESEQNLAASAQIEFINNSIREECLNFQAELKEVLERSRKIKVELGTDQEHIAMIKLADSLTKFQLELRDTTASQAAEIHYLKQALIQSFAWSEEARSRHLRFSDPVLGALMRAQELDPVNQARLSDLKHMLYYLESQLRQVDNTLDEQWGLFQDSCKKTMKLQVPTLEAVYQSMVRQNAILMKQSFLLKDIGARVKKSNKTSNSQLITTTALGNVGDIERGLKNMQIAPVDIMQGKYDRIVAREQKDDTQKHDRLRNYFINRNVVHVSTTKPCLSSSILNLTPDRSMKKSQPVFSSTAVNITNVKKNLFPDISKLDSFAADETPMSPLPQSWPFVDKSFLQSTPKPSANQQFKPVAQHENVPPLTTTKVSTSSNVENTQSTTLFGAKTSFFQQPPAMSFGTTAKIISASDTTAFKFPTANPTIASTTQQPNMDDSKPPQQNTNLFSVQSIIDKHETGKITSSVPAKSSSPPVTPIPNVAVSIGAPKTTTEHKHDSTTIVPANVSIFKVTDSSKTNLFAPAITTTTTFSTKTPVTIATPIFGSKATDLKEPTSPVTSRITITPIGKNTSIFGPSSIGSGGSAFAPLSGSIFGNTMSASTKPTDSIFSTTGTPQSNEPLSFGIPFAQQPTVPPSAPQTPVSSAAAASSKSELFNFPAASTSPPVSVAVPTESYNNSSNSGATVVDANLASTTATTLPAANSSIFGSILKSVNVPTSNIFATEKPDEASTVMSSDHLVETTKVPDIVKPVEETPDSSNSATSSTVLTSPFGNKAHTSSENIGTSLFGSGSAAAAPPSSGSTIFGSLPTATPLTTQSSTTLGQPLSGSLFATNPETNNEPPSSASVFGTLSAPSNPLSTGNIFGGSAANATKPIMTATPTTATLATFGSVTVTTTTAPGMFGQAVPTTAQPNIFGSSAPATTQTNVFGSLPVTPTTINVFGSSATLPVTQANVFGGYTGSPGAFGSSPPTSTTGSIFAQNTDKPTAFGSGGSIFGGSAVFGGATTTAPSPSFGGSQQSSFGTQSTGSIFGGSTQTATTTTSNIFRAPVTSASTFGATPNVFGAKPATNTAFQYASNTAKSEGSFSFGNLSVTALSPNSTPASTSSGFGFPAQNPFGKTNNSSFMGQNVCSPFSSSTTGSIFGAPTATTSSGGSIFGGQASTPSFGSPNGGFGTPPAFGSSNVFGQQQQQQQQSAFGQSTFGSPSTFSGNPGGTAFGSTPVQATPGNFSMGNQSVGQTGFGGFQKPTTGFGSAPVFGSPNAGGFGASPSFGGAPTFGTPPKVFGSTSPQPVPAGFGSPTQENPTFANLANQSTLGFGSLAQAQANPAPQSFSGGSSFSSWR